MKDKSVGMHGLVGGVSLIIALGAGNAMAQGAFDEKLKIDPSAYTSMTVTVDGKSVQLKRYEAVYVAKPIEMAKQQPARRMGPGGSPSGADTQALEDPSTYQKLAIFVPETATPGSAMILNVNNGGWFASELKEDIEQGGAYRSDNDTDKVGAALAAGYVYIDVGTRGRGIVAADGTLPGKAPAAVIDAKAAIRFLRLNDAALAGSAERIVITGTSGGGGLSSVVAASGNSPDYLPLLAEIGAAGVGEDAKSTLNDDVFAVIAYCPITDLSNADMAYEWLYRGIRTSDNTASNSWSAAAERASAILAEAYPAYLASLNLVLADATPLTSANMKATIAGEVRREVERHLASGGTVPARGQNFEITLRQRDGEQKLQIENDWVTVENGAVTAFDIDAYLRFVTKTAALKNVPAFDRTANSGNVGTDGENSLFGAAAQPYSNFSAFGWDNNEVEGDGSGADDTKQDWRAYTAGDGPGAALAEQIRLINPMAYLRTDAKAAPYWYIRHGMIDRDTSFAVEVALATAVRMDNDVKSVDFRMPWMTPHSGDYDVTEAYDWLAKVLEDAGDPAAR